MRHIAVKGLICLLLATTGNYAMAADTLIHNPFEQPVMNPGLHSGVNKRNGGKMMLRGTVIDGEDSMVNIDGKFYRLYQDVSGYRVVRIESASVTLQRGNNETVLTLNNDE